MLWLLICSVGFADLRTTFARYQDGMFLANRLIVPGIAIGRESLAVTLIEDETRNFVTNRRARTFGIDGNLRLLFSPTWRAVVGSTARESRDQGPSYGTAGDTRRLDAALFHTGRYLFGRTALAGRFDRFGTSIAGRDTTVTDAGGAGTAEIGVHAPFVDLIGLGEVTRTTLTRDQRGTVSIVPRDPLRLGPVRALVEGRYQQRSFAVRMLEDWDPRRTASFSERVRLASTPRPGLDLALEQSFAADQGSYPVRPSANYRVRTGDWAGNLAYEVVPDLAVLLDFGRRFWSSEQSIRFGTEVGDRRLFRGQVRFEPAWGAVSFLRRLSLDRINTPDVLNKNDRDVRRDELEATLALQLRERVRTTVVARAVNDDLVYVERFVSGNTQARRRGDLDARVEYRFGPRTVLTGRWAGRLDYLEFRFVPERNARSTTEERELRLRGEWGALLPELVLAQATDISDGYRPALGVYQRELVADRKKLSLRLGWRLAALLIVPSFELRVVETHNELTGATELRDEQSLGGELRGRIGSALTITGELKNERRKYEKPFYLASLTLGYRF